MLKSRWFQVVVMILVWGPVSAFALILQNVTSQKVEAGRTIELTFDQAVRADQFSIDFINETVQINLPSVQLKNGTQKLAVDADDVKSLFTYKVNNKMARTRVILEKGIKAQTYQAATQVFAEDSTLKILLTTQTQVKKTEVSEEAVQVAMTQAQEWIDKSKENPAEGLKKDLPAKGVQKAEAEGAIANTRADTNTTQVLKESAKESEIPVLKTIQEKPSDHKTGMMSRVLLSLSFIFVALLGFVYYAKRNFKKAPKNKNTQIKILTQHYMGPRKSLAMIRVAGETILIGVTDHNINLIKTLALLDEEIPEELTEQPNKDFSSTLSALFKKEKMTVASQDDSQDEFSISKIKDFVSTKLKDMKEM